MIFAELVRAKKENEKLKNALIQKGSYNKSNTVNICNRCNKCFTKKSSYTEHINKCDDI